MPRDFSPLFAQETAALEQSKVLHLVTVEIDRLTAVGTILAGNATVTFSDPAAAAQLLTGQALTVVGAGSGGSDLRAKVVDVTAELVLLDTVAETTVEFGSVKYSLMLNLADSNYDVQFGGVQYVRFPLQFSGIGISSDGSIEKAKLSVGNVSREIMYYVEMYEGLRNREVEVKTVFESALDEIYTLDPFTGEVTAVDNPDKDPTAYVLDMFTIDSYAADENVVQFQLDPAIDMEIRLPRRCYIESCSFKYRDPETCGYGGEEPLMSDGSGRREVGCGKTLTACKARKNAKRFGGFVGLIGNRRAFL